MYIKVKSMLHYMAIIYTHYTQIFLHQNLVNMVNLLIWLHNIRSWLLAIKTTPLTSLQYLLYKNKAGMKGGAF